MSADAQDALDALRAAFPSLPKRVGVAVSGGSDSLALMHLLADFADGTETELCIATVDHGLRADAPAEAALVARQAADRGLTPSLLHWSGWDGRGNLQEAARTARYDLLTNWAREQELSVVALGHTADDQAETVLMQLMRGAGVDGLAAMPMRRRLNGVGLIRPFLGLRRAQLRSVLESRGLSWAEDPSNADTRFDRVRARETMTALAPLGLTAEALSQVAGNMAQAREALDWHSFLTARDVSFVDCGALAMDLRKFRTLPDEIARRLVVRAVAWIGGGPHGPRRKAVRQTLDSLRDGKNSTLGGCRVLCDRGVIWIGREFNAVRSLRQPVEMGWDRRWRAIAPQDAPSDAMIGPLGRGGLRSCPDWKSCGRPYGVLIASPGIWLRDELIAAPFAGLDSGWRLELVGGSEDFYASLLSH